MLSVVIPCHNEEKSVARYDEELFPSLKALGVPYEIVAVDDGSTDGTAELLKKLPIELVQLKRRQGLGAALRAGFARAKGDWLVVLDADLTFHPAQIRGLILCQKATGADMVAGSPFLKKEGLTGVPWSRRLPSWLVNAFYRGLLDPRLTSYTPIFRLYRAAFLKALPLKSEGFEINAEIAAGFVRAKRSCAEVPAFLTGRREGRSKLSGLRELFRHARLVLRLLSSPAGEVLK